MKHINKTAIAILTAEFYDYPRNDWHYDQQYKLLVQMEVEVLERQNRKLSVSDLIALKAYWDAKCQTNGGCMSTEQGRAKMLSEDIDKRILELTEAL